HTTPSPPINRHQCHSWWRSEPGKGAAGSGPFHERCPNRQCSLTTRESKRLPEVKPTPHHSQQVWGITDKPGIAEVVGCTGFARSRACKSPLASATGRSTLEYSFQQVRHHICVFRGNDLLNLHRAPFEDFSLLVYDSLDRERRYSQSLVGQRAERHSHLKGCHFSSSQDQRRIQRQRADKSQAPGCLADGFDTHLLSDASGCGIERHLQGATKSYRPQVFVFVIPRTPLLILIEPGEGSVLNQRGWEKTAFSRLAFLGQGSEVDNRFEDRSRLTMCLRDAIELRPLVVAPANQSANFPSLRLHSDQTRLQAFLRLGSP